jgi:hypothetical protein
MNKILIGMAVLGGIYLLTKDNETQQPLDVFVYEPPVKPEYMQLPPGALPDRDKLQEIFNKLTNNQG